MSDRACSFPGCGRARKTSDGLCSGHRKQLTRSGSLSPLRRYYRNLPPEEKFWKYVTKGDGCWEWTGGTARGGYGVFYVSPDRPRVASHRYSLEIAGVGIPDGHDVDHLCRNPACVRPDHLEPVTHAENLRRAPFTAADLNRSKTHCKRGHEFTPENTYVWRGTNRACRACRSAA